MELSHYYSNVRELEGSIGDEFPVIVSNDTADGGKAGHLTEASKAVAARMIVQGLARLAPAEQAEEFRAAQAEAARTVEQLAAAGRVQLAVLSTADLDKLKAAANLKE